MTFLLDTNACIRCLNGKAPKIREHMRLHRPEEIRVCSVVKAELFAGAAKSTDPARTLARQQAFLSRFVSLPFDDAADEYGRVRAHLEMAGTPIGSYDLQVAAIALVHELTVVTHNTDEFGRVPGLSLEDWEL